MVEVALAVTCVIFFALLYVANQNAKVKIYEPTRRQVLAAIRETDRNRRNSSPRI